MPAGKKPWIGNRITRCFFGPIKRAPTGFYCYTAFLEDGDDWLLAYCVATRKNLDTLRIVRLKVVDQDVCVQLSDAEYGKELNDWLNLI